MRVVGIDACRKGWIAVVLDRDRPAQGRFLTDLDAFADAVGEVEAVGIDIPIGLPATGRRRADEEARQLLGPRRNSVFLTPPREVLTAPTHAEASARSRALSDHGISRQAYALGPKILQAETFAADTHVPVREVHPEVAFALLLGRPARWAKSTWAGLEERRAALCGAGIDLTDIGGAGGMAAPDDVLDAAVVAFSARRLARGEARCWPDPPEPGPDGTPMAIWA